MNNLKSFVFGITTMLLTSIHAPMLIAAEPGTQKSSAYPGYYPANFQQKGIVSEIKTGTHQIIIDGTQYVYRIDLQVHSPDQTYGSAFNLKVGQTLGFSFTERKNENPILTEVWVINTGDQQGS